MKESDNINVYFYSLPNGANFIHKGTKYTKHGLTEVRDINNKEMIFDVHFSCMLTKEQVSEYKIKSEDYRKEDITNEQHIVLVNRMMKTLPLNESSTSGWYFKWDKQSPKIFNKEGKIVAVLEVGDITGAYPTHDILLNANRLLNGNE